MSKIDATLVIRRDGAFWYEAHWLEVTDMSDPAPKYRVVEIVDGSDHLPPMIVSILPDRDDGPAPQE